MVHLSTLRNINGNNAISVIVMVHAYFNYILLTVLLDLYGNNINKIILFKLPLPRKTILFQIIEICYIYCDEMQNFIFISTGMTATIKH